MSYLCGWVGGWVLSGGFEEATMYERGKFRVYIEKRTGGGQQGPLVCDGMAVGMGGGRKVWEGEAAS